MAKHEATLGRNHSVWFMFEYRSPFKNGNGGFSKLKAVISDLFDFDAPQDMWRWRKVSEVAEQLNDFVHPQMSAAQINKILRSLTEDDSRLQIRNRAGVRMYLLPPLAV